MRGGKNKKRNETWNYIFIIALILCITLVFADNLIITTSSGPANGTYWNGSCLNFTFTAVGNDTEFDNASLYIDKVLSGTTGIIGNDTLILNLTNCSADSITEGEHSWYINVSDGNGNWVNTTFSDGAANMTIVVDRTLPVYDVGIFYLNESQRNQDNIYVTINITETYGANVTFTLYNVSKDEENVTVDTTTTTLNVSGVQTITQNWTGLSDGNYSFNVTVYDLATNVNATSRLADDNDGYLFTYMTIDTTAL